MRSEHIFSGAVFAVPGRLETPTGGYEYARQLIARARARHLPLRHWPLPPLPVNANGALADPRIVTEVRDRLSAAPTGWPVLMDGLAFGLMPPEVIAALPCSVAALIHHPLAEETGLSDTARASLARSERAALTTARVVIATSTHTAETLTTQYGVAPERLTVARPGTPRPGDGRHGRVLLPEPKAGVRLLSVGSLVPRKGHDVLIDALSSLRDTAWHLTIIGSAERDPATAAALTAQIERLDLGARVTLTGDAARADIDRALAEADVFVLASHHEGYGMAYAEAMASGLPVLGTTAGAIGEATRGAAQLVPPGDVDALRGALAPLIAEPEARARLAAASRAAAVFLPDWDETLDTVLKVLVPLEGMHHFPLH